MWSATGGARLGRELRVHAHRVVGDRRLLLRDKEWDTERVRRLRRRPDVEERREGTKASNSRSIKSLVEGAEAARILTAIALPLVRAYGSNPVATSSGKTFSASAGRMSTSTSTDLPQSSPSASRRLLPMSGRK